MTTIALFSSQRNSELRNCLLAYFFTNPDCHLYLREIARKIDADAANLSRELKRLEKEGIFSSKREGVQKYYSLNQSYPLYQELKSIVLKTIGVEGTLKNTLQKIPGIKRAFIFGSFAKGTPRADSDIDLCLIIKDKGFNEEKFLKAIHNLEKKFDREVSYNYYTEQEWQKKKQSKNSFITNMQKGKIIELIHEKN